MSPPRLAVVGGGVTGLAAAYELRRSLPDAEITLYEASPPGRQGPDGLH